MKPTDEDKKEVEELIARATENTSHQHAIMWCLVLIGILALLLVFHEEQDDATIYTFGLIATGTIIVLWRKYL
jgi:hypothetical protein